MADMGSCTHSVAMTASLLARLALALCLGLALVSNAVCVLTALATCKWKRLRHHCTADVLLSYRRPCGSGWQGLQTAAHHQCTERGPLSQHA